MVEEVVPGLQLNPLMKFNFAVSFPQLPSYANLKFNASAVTLPHYGFSMDPREEGNDSANYAMEEDVGDTLNISFIEDHSGTVTGFLEAMRNMVRDNQTRRRLLPVNYKTEILVRKLGRDLQPRIAWRATGAWLNKVNPVMLDYDDTGFVTIDAAFSIDDFELDPIDSPTASAARQGSPLSISQRNSLLSLAR